MNKLHWRKSYPWLYHLAADSGSSATTIFAPAGLHRDWVAYLHPPDRSGAFPVRCHNLREAMDCARRWAEYRGFEVAERFPAEVQPPSPSLAETNRRLAAMPPAPITAEDARRQVAEHRAEAAGEILKGGRP